MKNETIVGIHQPEHLPWLGFFNKISQSNIFVLLDNVQYEKNYFQNRNRIRTKDGCVWLTVPVLTAGKQSQLIKDVKIDNTKNWCEKHWKTISYSYGNAPFFGRYSGFFKKNYGKKWNHLAKLNESIIKHMIKELGIRVKLVRASDLDVHGSSTDLLLDICKKLDADTYLSGVSGRDYLEENKFKKENIKVMYQDFHHPTYPQQFKPFVSNMSAIDLLFNCGKDSLSILKCEKKVCA